MKGMQCGDLSSMIWGWDVAIVDYSRSDGPLNGLELGDSHSIVIYGGSKC
jgi:hypothetical protein